MPTKEQIQAAFKVFDADGDGFITRDELVAILTRPTSKRSHSKQEAEAIFAKADRNNDGRVDIDEFAAAWGASDLHGGRSGAATLAVDFVPEFPNLTPMLVMPFRHFVAQGCIKKSVKSWRDEALAKGWLVEFKEGSGKVANFISHTYASPH